MASSRSSQPPPQTPPSMLLLLVHFCRVMAGQFSRAPKRQGHRAGPARAFPLAGPGEGEGEARLRASPGRGWHWDDKVREVWLQQTECSLSDHYGCLVGRLPMVVV